MISQQLSFQSIKSEDKAHQNGFRVPSLATSSSSSLARGKSCSWGRGGGRRLKELYPCKGMFNLEAAERMGGRGGGETTPFSSKDFLEPFRSFPHFPLPNSPPHSPSNLPVSLIFFFFLPLIPDIFWPQNEDLEKCLKWKKVSKFETNLDFFSRRLEPSLLLINLNRSWRLFSSKWSQKMQRSFLCWN